MKKASSMGRSKVATSFSPSGEQLEFRGQMGSSLVNKLLSTLRKKSSSDERTTVKRNLQQDRQLARCNGVHHLAMMHLCSVATERGMPSRSASQVASAGRLSTPRHNRKRGHHVPLVTRRRRRRRLHSLVARESSEERAPCGGCCADTPLLSVSCSPRRLLRRAHG